MSYNVSGFRVKENSLTITEEAVRAFIEGYSKDAVEETKDAIEIYFGEGCVSLKPEGICEHCGRGATGYTITDLNPTGDGSGNVDENFDALMEKTKGHLFAIQVWEGGDSLNSYEVKDGRITTDEL